MPNPSFLKLLSDLLGMLTKDFYRRYNMRGVLYNELADMFCAVEDIMAVTEVPEWDRCRWQREELNKALRFRGEKYCEDKTELYMRLPERGAVDMLYHHFHQIVKDEQWLNVNTSLALSAFSFVVHDKTLKPMYFRLFRGRKGAAALRRSAERRYRQNEESLKLMDEAQIEHQSLMRAITT